MVKRLETDEASRTYLLDLYAKLGPLWNRVPDHSITWIGTAGEMDFTPTRGACANRVRHPPACTGGESRMARSTSTSTCTRPVALASGTGGKT